MTALKNYRFNKSTRQCNKGKNRMVS